MTINNKTTTNSKKETVIKQKLFKNKKNTTDKENVNDSQSNTKYSYDRGKRYNERVPMIAAIIVMVVMLLSLFVFCKIIVVDDDDGEILGDYSSKKVLFLSSYDYSYITVPSQVKGVNNILSKYQVRVDYEFMNTKKFPGKETIDDFYLGFKNRMKVSKGYDVVLAIDDPALDFALKYQNEFFKNVPIIFMGINDKEKGINASNNKNISGNIENTYIKDTVECALSLHSKRKRIIAVSDNTSTGRGELKEFYIVSKKYPNKEFIDVNTSNCTKEELEKMFNDFTKDDLVIFLNMQEDKEGDVFSLDEAMKFVAKNCDKVPVYSSSVIGINTGIIGGKSVDFYIAGQEAAKKIIDIFKGKKINDMEVKYNVGEKFWFDAYQLEKFKINYNKLPDNKVVYNYYSSYFETNKNVILIVELVLYIIFVVFLIIAIDNKKKNILISELEKSYEELFTKEKQIRYMAEHDELTGLFNRRAMENDLNEIISQKCNFTIIHIDVDDFKFINDTYGHACGDKVLSEIGARFIKVGKRYNFHTYRIGGDEFLIIIKDKFVQQNTIIIDEIMNVKSEKIHFKNKEIYVSFSMGMAYHNGSQDTVMNVIIKADLAMYQAKHYGKNNLVLYSEHLKENETRKQKVKQDVKEACEKDDLYVEYQPQYLLKGQALSSFEALARLKSNKYRASEFIPIIEETDIIIPLGRKILKHVITDISNCLKEKIEMLPVSINFSIKQLEDEGYFEYMIALLKEYDVPIKLIEIEITESFFDKNSSKVTSFFEQIEKYGINIVLDEFGVGYNSINYLSVVPIKKVKIDKCIVNENSSEKNIFLKNIIKIVHSLDLAVVVEGIENEREFERLKEYDCDFAQGYYLSRPTSIDEIKTLISEDNVAKN